MRRPSPRGGAGASCLVEVGLGERVDGDARSDPSGQCQDARIREGPATQESSAADLATAHRHFGPAASRTRARDATRHTTKVERATSQEPHALGIRDFVEHVIAESGHMFRFTHPVTYSRHIAEFLQSRVPTTTTTVDA